MIQSNGEGIRTGEEEAGRRTGLLHGDSVRASRLNDESVTLHGLDTRLCGLLCLSFILYTSVAFLGLPNKDGIGLTLGVPGVKVSELAAELTVLGLVIGAAIKLSVSTIPQTLVGGASLPSLSLLSQVSGVDSPMSKSDNKIPEEDESSVVIAGTSTISESQSVSHDAIGASLHFGGLK